MKASLRRCVIIAAIVCAAALTGYPAAHGAEKGPIKIGYFAPMVGNFAQMGEYMMKGAKLFLEKHGYSVAGRKVEVLWTDEGTGPDVGVRNAWKLIKHDKVHLIAGVWLGPLGYALLPVADQAQFPIIVDSTSGDDLTMRKRSPWLATVSHTGGDIGHVAGDFAYKDLGWRTAAICAWDFSWGHECAGGFHEVFEDLGGKVIQVIRPPLNTMDYSPYISRITREADGVFEVVTGTASIRFLKGFESQGLMKKMGLICPGTSIDPTQFEALGDTGLGGYSVENYCETVDNPPNRKFIELCKKNIGEGPSWTIHNGYLNMQWIFAAIEAIKGDVENKEKLRDAIRAVKLEDSIRGPDLSMDEYGHLRQNYYVRKYVKGPEGNHNKVVKTYPKVSQFWRWSPEEYMSRPVYSNTYPPCKHCK